MGEGRIAHFEAEVQRLQSELKVAKEALDEARMAVAPFHAGDIVEANVYTEWRQAVVRRVIPQAGGRFWYRCSFPTKSGWSKREQTVFQVRELESVSTKGAG